MKLAHTTTRILAIADFIFNSILRVFLRTESSRALGSNHALLGCPRPGRLPLRSRRPYESNTQPGQKLYTSMSETYTQFL